MVAEFQLALHSWLYLYLYGNLGICLSVSDCVLLVH
jgi:hypothetical protein